jgi:hypothetical protein
VKRSGLVALVVAFAMACGAAERAPNGSPSIPGAPSAQGASVEGNVKVTSVRAFIKDGRLQAFVQGELGDGCTSLQSATQRRTVNSIDVIVTSTRQGETCTMILQYLNEWVALEGTFEPGEYVVRANTRAVQFRLVRTASGDLRVDPDPGPLPQPPYLPPRP